MSTINDSDTFLVQRGANSYKQSASNLMSTIQDTDWMLINRGGASYKVSGADIKNQLGGPDGTSSDIISVTPLVTPYYLCSDSNHPSSFYNYGSPFRGDTSPGYESACTAAVETPVYSVGGYEKTVGVQRSGILDNYGDYPFTGTFKIWMCEMAPGSSAQFSNTRMPLTFTDANGTRTETFNGVNANFTVGTVSGLVNCTSVKFEVGTGAVGSFQGYAVWKVTINDIPLVWGEQRQNITVQDATGFNVGDAVAVLGGASGGTGKIMSKYNNTLNLYDVRGTITADGKAVRLGGGDALPPSNANVYASKSPTQPGFDPQNKIIYW